MKATKLQISIAQDGIFLIFDVPGKSAAINLESLALDGPPITRDALLEWCARCRAQVGSGNFSNPAVLLNV